MFCLRREIQGARGQDRILQGLLFRRWRHPPIHLDISHRRNEARIEFGWLHLPRVHVLQGPGGRQEHRRRRYPVDDILDHFLLHEPHGRHLPLLATIGKLFLHHQGIGRNLVVPPKDHRRTGNLQQWCETLPRALDGRIRAIVKEDRVNERRQNEDMRMFQVGRSITEYKISFSCGSVGFLRKLQNSSVQPEKQTLYTMS